MRFTPVGRPIFWNQFQASTPTFYDGCLVPVVVDVGMLRDNNLQTGREARTDKYVFLGLFLDHGESRFVELTS